jgi:hypothetical protein
VVDPARLKRSDRRVKVQGDRFAVGGRPVFLHGVNYWARNVSGMEPGRYHSGWLTARNYDPEVVEADLAELERLGMNLVSVQYAGGDQARPLIDFMERCRRHGIWANLYTGSAGGLSSNPERDQALLEAALLPGNDTVFAYDINWEPRLGSHAERQRHDALWRAWLADQYGSVEAAERLWGVKAPRLADGQVTNPTDDQITSDGPHRVMVAAYRRFADDLISRRYGVVAQTLRRLDPDALIGTRTGYGGTGRSWPARVMAFDLTSGAAHLDFTSPEGYGMPAEYQAARGTGFVTAWGKWAGNGKPVFWSEFGASIGARGGSPATRANQTGIWESTLRMVADSGGAATAGWWWPGGWRVDEKSDFGVVEPWGEPREAAKVAAELGRQYNERRPADTGQPVTITVDRDIDPRGLAGLWPKHEAEYLAARRAGRPVRLVTPGTGTTTATMPLVQVGNLPYAGVGPLKYANAEVSSIQVGWPAGGFTVDNGGEVQVPAGTTVQVSVTLLNTGEATWLEAGAGAVQLGLAGQTATLKADVPRFGQATFGPVTVRVTNQPMALQGRLQAAGKGAFGEVVRVKITLGG